MTLQSSGAISLLNIQTEFKGTDALIELLTGVSKLSPTVWTNDAPFPGRSATTGTETPSSQVTLSSSTIDPKTSYGSITYSNTSNDNQLSEYSIPISEYYRGEIYVSNKDSSDTLVNQNVPTSGEISFANFYEGINEDIILFINSNRENLNLETAFNTEIGNGSWTNKRRKRLIINRGIVIGGTYPNGALLIPANLIGGLIIINYGDIVGYGGPQQGQSGGTAIVVGSPEIIITTYTINKISHNLKSGIYGVIPLLSGLDYRNLTPIGLNKNGLAETNSSIAHGTGEFSVGDSIYIYNIKTFKTTDGRIIKHPISDAEQLPNLCKIESKSTATFIAYISNGKLATAGNILSVISVAQPSVGMGIITGSTYKKHIITDTYTITKSAAFNGNKLLNNSLASFSDGMVIFGDGVVEGTIVIGNNSFYPNSQIAEWGTISGNIFTLKQTPSEPILSGYNLLTNVAGEIYIVKHLGGNQYEVSKSVTGFTANVYSYGYIIVNKSQTITGPVNVTGIKHILNDDQQDGITGITGSGADQFNTREVELVSTPTSMTAVSYRLDRNVNISELANKSSGFKFFTAGGTTSPGFTVTTTTAALSALSDGRTVTISGTTANISTQKFNDTWFNIIKKSSTEFFVATTKIDNIYSSGSGTFPLSTTPDFTTPIKILNNGRIYGGGGGGSNSVGTRGTKTLRFFGNKKASQILPINSINNTSVDTIASRVTIGLDPGFNGVGGKGQGYNQPKTSGTAGTPNPNSQRYAIIECFANFTYDHTDPYLDLISIPENTKFKLFMYGSMISNAVQNRPIWKDVVFGKGTSLYDSASDTYTLNLRDYSYVLRIGNLYNFSSELVKINVSNRVNYIDKIYTDSLTWKFYGTAQNVYNLKHSTTLAQYGPFQVGSSVVLGGITNTHPQDRVRIITTGSAASGTPKFEYDMNFAEVESNLALAAGDGGDFGSPGKLSASATIPAGNSGNYIQNSSIYSNVTWIITGDVKGTAS